MSNKVQGLIWDIEFPNAMAKIIALKLADNANDEGGDIYPSTTTVAKKTGCSRSVVCKWQFAMEHCGMLLVVERSAGGENKNTTERAFNMPLLRRLAWADRHTPPELVLDEETIERPSLDADGAPKLEADGTPKVTKITVLVAKPRPTPVRETDGCGDECSSTQPAPVRVADGSTQQPSASRTGPVRETDTTRPPDGHKPFELTLQANLFDSPSQSPTTSAAPSGKPVGGRGKNEWIEELREAGHPPAVLDEFLHPLLRVLKPWKDFEDAPQGPAEQICRDLQHEPVAVIEALREAILDEQATRMPYVKRIRELLPEVRAEVERDRELARNLAETPAVECSALASQRFLDALGRISKHHRKSWFDCGGVAKVDEPPGFIEIVSPSPGKLIDQFASSNVRAAIRMAFNKDLEPRYVRGRAVTSKGASA